MNTPDTPHWRERACPPSVAARSLSGRFLGRFLALTAALLFSLPFALAQTGAGAIEGRVSNAATGESLNNARVTLKGTSRTVYTDPSGTFHFANVPAGPVTLQVFFTGLDQQETSLNVSAASVARQDVALTSQSLYGKNDTVKLDEFIVASTRETNAAAIAVNEQRVAPNIKSVVSTDEFGVIPDSNPGEFLKWLPGVGVEYFANNITGVNVRGLGAVNTEINFDGMTIASANADGTSRSFELMGASASDLARVEVRKLPLPEDSANAIGGSINFVRRSAFEFSHRRIDYSVLFTTDGEKFTFAEREGPRDAMHSWWQPNWSVKWTEPVTKNFGTAFTIGQSNAIVHTRWNLPTWMYGTGSGAAAGAPNQLAQATADAAANKTLNTVSLLNPAMSQMLLHDAPKRDSRTFVTLRADWRPIPALTLSDSIAYTKFHSMQADDIRYTWDTGARATNNASNDPQYVDRRTTVGPAGKGAIYYNTPLWRDIDEDTVVNTFEAKWRRDLWTAGASASISQSKYWIASGSHGMFNSIDGGGVPHTGVGTGTANPIPLTVTFADEDYRGPRQITSATTANGLASSVGSAYTVPVDWSSASVARIGGAVDRPGRSKVDLFNTKLFVKRDFTWENATSVQLGFDYSDEYRNRRYAMNVWRFVGADHTPNSADDTASLIAADHLSRDRDPYAQLPSIDHLSLTKLYSLYQAHPDWFQYDPNQSLRNTANNSYRYTEKISAPYVEVFQNFFHNRLQIVGGIRFEHQVADGLGFYQDQSAAYQKYANGQVKHAGDVVGADGLPTKVSGNPVYLPGVTSGSLAEALLTFKELGAHGHGEINNAFPSAHADFDLTPNLKLQFGYAKVQAKNQLTRSVVPNNTVSDSPQADGGLGLVNIRNADLKPWIAYNEDLRLAYYSQTGGVIAVGLFRKSIHNWQQSNTDYVANADESNAYGLNGQYVGYDVNTLFNNGNARIDGAEFEMTQSLNPLIGRYGEWFKGYTVTANYTYTNLIGQPANSDLGSVYDYRFAFNVRYNRRKLDVMLGWIRNGPNANGVVTPTGLGFSGPQIQREYDMIDFSVNYAVKKWAKIFVSGRNVHGAWRLREARIPGAPSYALLNSSNNYGITYTAGVTGSF